MDWGGGNPVATQVSGLSEIVQVAAGHGHSLAIKLDGTLWAWGANGVGQLGDGTTTTRNSPVQVKIADVAHVAGGGAHSLAVKLDGTVWAWGWNNATQLGTGTNINYTTVPLQVSGLTGAVQVGAGFYQSLAVKADGTAYGWGMNSSGQVGDGTTTGRGTPSQVSGLTGALSIAGGASHSIAVKIDGTVWAWGYNGAGRLGDGTTNQRNAPVKVAGITGAVMAGAGDAHSVIVKSDGTVWAAGDNTYGQIGDGTSSARYTAVQTSGLTGQTNVVGRHYQSLSVASVPLVARRPTAVTIAPISVAYAGPISLSTTLTILNSAYPLGNRAITFKVDGVVVGGTNTSTLGTAATTFPANFSIGKHTAEIDFAGDDGFAPSSATALLTVAKSNSSLAITARTGAIGTTQTLIAVLSRKSDGSKLANALLTYTIGATTLGTATTDAAGKATLLYAIPDTFGVGAQTFTVSYAGDALDKPGAGSKTLTITKALTTLTQPSASGKVGATATLTATLKRSNGFLLSGKTIHFQVNGVAVGDGTTDANGVATLIYTIPTGTVVGKYPMVTLFDGDDLNLTVKRSGASLIVK